MSSSYRMLWRGQRLVFCLWGLLVTCVCSGAIATQVTRISWDSQPTFNRFVVEFDQSPLYHSVDAIKDKGYFYIDVYGISLVYKRRILPIDDALLRQVEAISYPEYGVLRFVFYVKNLNAEFAVHKLDSPPRLIIDTVYKAELPTPPPTDSANVTHSTELSSVTPTNPIVIRDQQVVIHTPSIPEPQRLGNRSSSSGRKKYIIIDPGHGGANHGAKAPTLIGGQPVLEKDLTMQFAYHLKKVIDGSPNMVAFLTRTDDRLLSLEDRVRFAEQNQGDLFLSIHMNDGAGNPNARGIEFFYLSEKGTADAAAKAVAERENMEVGTNGAPTTQGTPLLRQILTDLERGKLEDWQYESYLVAKSLLTRFQQHPYFAAYVRGIKSANFVVLKNFYMPAVLIEVGFITNTDELRYLVNPRFQRLTAIIIYNALNDYFAQNDPAFQPHYLRLTEALTLN